MQDSADMLRSFIETCGGQKAAALKLGVSPQFIGQLFHGQRRVPRKMLKKLTRHQRPVAEK